MNLINLHNFLSLNRTDRSDFCKEIVPLLPDGFWFQDYEDSEDQLPTYIDSKTGIPFKLVLSDSFMMGCSEAEEAAARQIQEPPNISFDELRPYHEYRINPFLMSITPVLLGEHNCLVAGSNNSTRKWPGAPVSVTRNEATTLLDKLGCRLPREAEWEYACRAQTQTLFTWGDTLPSELVLARWLEINFAGNIQRAANRFGFKGLFVGEWCLDEWRPNYSSSSASFSGEYVVRGGGSMFWPWQDCGEWVWCMSSMRMPSSALPPERACGFRLVYEIDR